MTNHSSFTIHFALKIIIFILLANYVLPQSKQITIHRDTSYTSKSALIKVNKKYPKAVLVQYSEDSNLIIYKDLEYTNYDGRKLRLDLFSPIVDSNNMLPLVILIHGGGWASGDRSMLIPLAQQLAENGFISAAVEYRLSPEEKYPAAVNDIITSIKWLKYHSHEYNIDSSKVTLLGTSAGGHLATYVSTTWKSKSFSTPDSLDDVSARLAAVIDIDGVLDLTDPAESGKDDDPSNPSVLKRWLGYTYKEKPKLWQDVSPVNHVDEDTPPILFINSSIPRFHAGRDRMIEKMKDLNIYSEVHTLKNSPHSFWLFDQWFEPTKQYVIEFLDKVFYQ